MISALKMIRALRIALFQIKYSFVGQ